MRGHASVSGVAVAIETAVVWWAVDRPAADMPVRGSAILRCCRSAMSGWVTAGGSIVLVRGSVAREAETVKQLT